MLQTSKLETEQKFLFVCFLSTIVAWYASTHVETQGITTPIEIFLLWPFIAPPREISPIENLFKTSSRWIKCTWGIWFFFEQNDPACLLYAYCFLPLTLPSIWKDSFFPIKLVSWRHIGCEGVRKGLVFLQCDVNRSFYQRHVSQSFFAVIWISLSSYGVSAYGISWWKQLLKIVCPNFFAMLLSTCYNFYVWFL